MLKIFDLQCRLAALGHQPGPLDDLWGPRTEAALRDAAAAARRDPADWRAWIIHPSGLHRIVMHWTAGAYGDIALERRAYHVLIARDGRAVMGDYAPEANADCTDGRYAAHTRALNTGSIGLSIDAMAGAHERPFDHGPSPITEAQVAGLVREVADLCLTYSIPVSPYSVLTHAEVQGRLGVAQKAKWDITWLPGMTAPGPATAVGDRLRADIARAMQ